MDFLLLRSNEKSISGLIWPDGFEVKMKTGIPQHVDEFNGRLIDLRDPDEDPSDDHDDHRDSRTFGVFDCPDDRQVDGVLLYLKRVSTDGYFKFFFYFIKNGEIISPTEAEDIHILENLEKGYVLSVDEYRIMKELGVFS